MLLKRDPDYLATPILGYASLDFSFSLSFQGSGSESSVYGTLSKDYSLLIF
jgi:hypothetical protein